MKSFHGRLLFAAAGVAALSFASACSGERPSDPVEPPPEESASLMGSEPPAPVIDEPTALPAEDPSNQPKPTTGQPYIPVETTNPGANYSEVLISFTAESVPPDASCGATASASTQVISGGGELLGATINLGLLSPDAETSKFLLPGTYTVTVTCTTDAGDETTLTQEIRVVRGESSALEFSPSDAD